MEDTNTASEPQVHTLNEASSQLLLEKACTVVRGLEKAATVVGSAQRPTPTKSMKLKKMHPRSSSLSVLRVKSEKNNNRKAGG